MKNQKTIETAQRALKILQNLMHQNLSVDEILDKLDSNDDYSIVYTKEAIYKYFNTFKFMGINIEKENGKYFVKNLFNTDNFSEENILILDFLESYIRATQQNNLLEKFNRIKDLIKKNNIDLTTKIVSLDYEKIYKINKKYEKYKQLIQDLEKLCRNKQIIKLTYKENSSKLEHKIVANKIIFEKGNFFLNAYCDGYLSMMNLLIENIENIQPLPQRANKNYFPGTVIFKLFDELAINYKLKNGEYIKEQGTNYIIVANASSSEANLIKRLLRYGDKCQIMYPKATQNDIKSNIERALAIYKN